MNLQQHINSPDELGHAVRERRKRLGLTQEELANAAGISRKTVSEIEGRGEGRVASIFRLLAMLGLSMSLNSQPEAPRAEDEFEIGVDL